MKRNIVLLYVYYHQGCEKKDIDGDLDINSATIGTSLSVGVENGNLTYTGSRPRQYYCKQVDATAAEISQYVFSVIKRHEHLSREQLCTITGLTMHTVSRELTRLKNLGKINSMTGHGIYLVKDSPKPMTFSITPVVSATRQHPNRFRGA